MRNKHEDTKEAKALAKEFLRRLETFEDGDGAAYMCEGNDKDWPWPSHEWAAVKRTSMDLTRALANLRKSRYSD